MQDVAGPAEVGVLAGTARLSTSVVQQEAVIRQINPRRVTYGFDEGLEPFEGHVFHGNLVAA
jgi:hypothetical protein